ncbi:hypothetical protein AUEXF2481DRAFT_9136 [Aureobasidium subglaciale EXF-2481]|uniref:BTB domain-containing protein n=1 Tax=Aureobasidium subglaciale (strain EXF-2481) TaxID=1043005 RepID=A0A074Y9J4_AURSE|nr:uncharacterized protein AUEXF2481DRAFT_9136 [Aureobasidium subglaciale EXF-2481]KEQ90862.1 hypothetical protein AUEXF2481DRAFT_9136 [Aureobasidium subglaciale EXF-2481]
MKKSFRHVLPLKTSPHNTRKGSDAKTRLSTLDISQGRDVVLELRCHKFFAHRAVLSENSPFFKRAFNSKFSVATSLMFSLDDIDDDPEIVATILNHVYHVHNEDIPTLSAGHFTLDKKTEFCYSVYMTADKYDCPLVRQEVCRRFFNATGALVKQSGSTSTLTPIVATICGPKALQLTDLSLEQCMLKICAVYIDAFVLDRGFIRELGQGNVLSIGNHEKLDALLSHRHGTDVSVLPDIQAHLERYGHLRRLSSMWSQG